MKKNGFFKGILAALSALLFVSCGDMLTLSDTASLTLSFPWGNERSVSAADVTDVKVTLYSLDRDILIDEQNLTASNPNASFTNLKAENVRVEVKALKVQTSDNCTYTEELASCQKDLKLKNGSNTVNINLYLNPLEIAKGSKGSITSPCLTIPEFLNVLSATANKERTTVVYVESDAFSKENSGNSAYCNSQQVENFDIPGSANAQIYFMKANISEDGTTTYSNITSASENSDNIEFGPQMNMKSGSKLTFMGRTDGLLFVPSSAISGGKTSDNLIVVEEGASLKFNGVKFTEVEVSGSFTLSGKFPCGSWGDSNNTYINCVTLKKNAELILSNIYEESSACVYLEASASSPKIVFADESVSKFNHKATQTSFTGHNSSSKVHALIDCLSLMAADPLSFTSKRIISPLSRQYLSSGKDYNDYIVYYHGQNPDSQYFNAKDYSFAEDGTLRECITNIFDLPENASGKYYVSSCMADQTTEEGYTTSPLTISNDVTIVPKVVYEVSSNSTNLKSVGLGFKYSGASTSDDESSNSTSAEDSALITVRNGASLKFETFPDGIGAQVENYYFKEALTNSRVKNLFLIEEKSTVELPPAFTLTYENLTENFAYNRGTLILNKDTSIYEGNSSYTPYVIISEGNAKTYLAGANIYVERFYLKGGATLTLANDFSTKPQGDKGATLISLDGDQFFVGKQIINLEEESQTLSSGSFTLECIGNSETTSLEVGTDGKLKAKEDSSFSSE